MASNRRRSLRKLNNYVNRIDREVRRMSKRQSVTRLADASVGTPQLAEGAVTGDILDETIVTDISDANTNAGTALTNAATALSTANGKNKIYRQTTQPTGGTYAEGDLWFDTDDDNKIYRYSPTPSPVWTGFTLGDSALASLSATKITAGTIDASVITVSNLDAGNITTGTLTSREINNGSGTFLVTEGGDLTATSGSIAGWALSSDTISAAGGEIALYQEPGYGAVIAGTGAGTQIILNSEAQLHAEFSGVDTDINFQTDTAYVFRISDGSQLVRISPLLIAASVGGSFSYLANDGIYTTNEVGMNTGSVNGIGIMYPGCTTGPGNFNYMGLVWDNPNIRGTVDNVVSAVLGTVSDIRSKANIVNAPSDWALKTLNDLRVVEYNPINILNPDDKTEKPKRLGLIAQELADVFPELVTSVNADDHDAIHSVDYLGLVPHLIQVIKLLNDKIESIEQRIGE